MSGSGNSAVWPKSMRHKQILDVAAENPEATIDELAREVPSATPDLVERVLDEYGDPASAESDEPPADADAGNTETGASDTTETGANDTDGVTETGADDTDDGTKTGKENQTSGTGEREEEPDPEDRREPESTPQDREGGAEYPSAGELSEKQLETLRIIAEHPEAPQRELAEHLGVTAATVSRRMNTIDGFEWSEREAFAEAVLPAGADPSTADAGTSPESDDDAETGPASNDDEADAEANEDGTDSEPNDHATDGEESVSTGTSPDDTSAAATEMSADESLEEAVGRLAERVADLETEVDALRTGSPAFDDVELTHKVVRACVNSPEVSADEELRILEALLE